MNDNTPRVSIGLPVYNGEHFLAESIASVLGQTYTDFELIISDNGSIDRTEEICRKFADQDSRVRYYREPKNRGIAWNFTRAFELARGELFKWHAHDDICEPTLVQRSVEMFDVDPEAALCYPRCAIIDEQGQLVPEDPSNWRPPGDDLPVEAEPHGLNSPVVSRRYYGVLLETVWCLESYGMVRSDVMRKTGKLRGYRAAEKVFLAEVALHGRFREIPEVLLLVRRHAQQYTMLPSAAAQQQSVKPRRKRLRLPMPHHVRSTLGYLALLPSAPISYLDRVRCLGVWCRYVLQVSKWKRIALNTLRDVGIHDGYLRVPESKSASEVSRTISQPNGRHTAPLNSA